MKARRDILRPFSAPVINISAPRAESFEIEDIARGLAYVCRFAGQINRFYSVAAHSINASIKAAHRGYGPRRQLYALLHDAAEAFVSDVPSPVKVSGFKKIEKRLLNVICKKFLGVRNGADLPAWLKEIDDELLTEERLTLYHLDIYQDTAYFMADRCAFLNRFHDLRRQIFFGDEYVQNERLAD